MALIVHVSATPRGSLYVNAITEGGYSFFSAVVSRQENMTAAETVELYMLDHNYVASWFWDTNYEGLVGQFVAAPPQGKAYKEISYSAAHEYDI